jgi:hypothetical protein
MGTEERRDAGMGGQPSNVSTPGENDAARSSRAGPADRDTDNRLVKSGKKTNANTNYALAA